LSSMVKVNNAGGGAIRGDCIVHTLWGQIKAFHLIVFQCKDFHLMTLYQLGSSSNPGSGHLVVLRFECLEVFNFS
jgi:hypothetical protein